MKSSKVAPSLLAGLLAGACLVMAASGNQVFELASILSGTFQGSTPGNELRLDMRSLLTDSQHPYDFFLEVTGRYQGENVRQQGLLRLELQGRDITVGYIPHFDTTVTSLSSDATRFTEGEANAACSFQLKPRGDGFAGEILAGSCALAMRGALGKWTIEIEPGSIRLREAKSGETLRFKRVSKS